MKITKAICLILVTVLSLATCQSCLWADAGPTAEKTKDDPKTIKHEPKVSVLSKEELTAIARLSIPELAEMLKNGDTPHRYAALRRLRGNKKKNFDLLLSIAAERGGDVIVEGLVRPIRISASAEDKRMVGKFLDLLESQLKKDKPSVSRRQAVRSIAQTVYLAAAIRPAWRPYRPSRLKDPNDLLKVPYANERVVNILIRCLESKDRRVRSEAIRRLGSVGANDLAKANDIVSLLNAQAVKEEGSKEKEKIKAGMRKDIQRSLKRLNREIDYFMDEFKKVQMMSIMSGRSEPEPTPD